MSAPVNRLPSFMTNAMGGSRGFKIDRMLACVLRCCSMRLMVRAALSLNSSEPSIVDSIIICSRCVLRSSFLLFIASFASLRASMRAVFRDSIEASGIHHCSSIFLASAMKEARFRWDMLFRNLKHRSAC